MVRMPIFIMLVFSATFNAGQSLQKRFVSVTFDDLPVVCRCPNDAARLSRWAAEMGITKRYSGTQVPQFAMDIVSKK